MILIHFPFSKLDDVKDLVTPLKCLKVCIADVVDVLLLPAVVEFRRTKKLRQYSWLSHLNAQSISPKWPIHLQLYRLSTKLLTTVFTFIVPVLFWESLRKSVGSLAAVYRNRKYVLQYYINICDIPRENYIKKSTLKKSL